MATDTGVNLLTPGETPYENAQFLLFLCAVIQAVDDYQDLLRLSVATAGNDHRLGANEAPPAVVSMFLGDELTAVLDAIEKDEPYSGAEKTVMKLGVHVLPKFTRDTTDRNRTSPFAFTGNKFEFRMLGSSNSIACANIMLNAAVAESLKQLCRPAGKGGGFRDGAARHDPADRSRLTSASSSTATAMTTRWIEEATEKRGLLNLRTTPDCAAHAFWRRRTWTCSPRHKVYLRGRAAVALRDHAGELLQDRQHRGADHGGHGPQGNSARRWKPTPRIWRTRCAAKQGRARRFPAAYEKGADQHGFPRWRTRSTTRYGALESALIKYKTISDMHRGGRRDPRRDSAEDGGAARRVRRGRECDG